MRIIGYRSDVSIAIKKNDYIDMVNAIKSLNIEEFRKTETYNFLTKDCTINKIIGNNNDNSDILILQWENVKWYEDDVKYFYHVVYIMNCLKTNIRHEIVIIGEDIEDIEYHNNLYDCYLDIIRKPKIVQNHVEISYENILNEG